VARHDLAQPHSGQQVSQLNRKAVVAGIHNTRQARRLDGETSRSLVVEATKAALADAGLTLADVDGVSAGAESASLIYDFQLGPSWMGMQFGLAMVLEAAAAIESGQAEVILLVTAEAGVYTERSSTAPWTRPGHEFVIPWGLFTAAEFALVARRHMHLYGTTPAQLARVSATIRNNGHVNPDAVYYGRGPFTPQDILDSRMVADPFHLLDCSTATEGGCAIVMTTAERARDLAKKPVALLGGGTEYFGPAYRYPPKWDLTGRSSAHENGLIGRRSSARAFQNAGVSRDDVDVLELYDPFSFEIIRQLEAFGFCGPGEGGAFVDDGHIDITGSHPVTTDGGTMSYSHAGATVQMLQRVIRGVQQIRGECVSGQVPNAEVALCSNAGAGALFHMVALLGALN
jgi:acetyl-CoA acetyltransferase